MNGIEYVYPSQTPRHDKACEPCTYPGGTGGGDLSFKDVIDAVNPLQQLPVVGTLYRAVSGDTISTISQLAGGALFGGPIGFLVAAVNAGFEAATGHDIGGHVLAMLNGEAPDKPTQLASANIAYMQAQKLS